MKLIFALLVAIVLFSGCTSQLVYQTSINLPKQQLKEKEFDIKAGAALFPETRMINDKYVESGVYLDMGYGFSDKFNLNFAGWMALDTDPVVKSGMSLASYIAINSTDKYDLLLYPRFGFVLDDNSYQGFGIELPVILNYRFSENFYSYWGAGFAIGFRESEKIANEAGEYRSQYGYGVIGHIGAGWYFNENFRAVIEFNPILQINKFDDYTKAALSPNLGIAYTF